MINCILLYYIHYKIFLIFIIKIRVHEFVFSGWFKSNFGIDTKQSCGRWTWWLKKIIQIEKCRWTEKCLATQGGTPWSTVPRSWSCKTGTGMKTTASPDENCPPLWTWMPSKAVAVGTQQLGPMVTTTYMFAISIRHLLQIENDSCWFICHWWFWKIFPNNNQILK